MKEKIKYTHEISIDANSLDDVTREVNNVLADLDTTMRDIIPVFEHVSFKITRFEVKYIAELNKAIIKLETEVLINDERQE